MEEQKRRRQAYEAAQQEQEARPEQARPRPVQRKAQRPQEAQPRTLTQAQRQLYAPQPAEQHHIDAAEEARCAETSRLKQQQRKQELQQRYQPEAAASRRAMPSADPQVRRNTVSLRGNALVQGVIMAEILGPPRAKKRQIRNF